MSIAEMKKAIVDRIDTLSETELEELLQSLDRRPQKKVDINQYIRENYRRVIEEDRDLLQRLAQ